MGEAEDPEAIKNTDVDDFNPFLLYLYDLLRRYHKALCFQQLKALVAGGKSILFFLSNSVDL